MNMEDIDQLIEKHSNKVETFTVNHRGDLMEVIKKLQLIIKDVQLQSKQMSSFKTENIKDITNMFKKY